MREKRFQNKTTDWTAYYSKPKSGFSTFTQKFTLYKILYYIEKYIHASADIMELGGGNSCFAESLMKLCKISVKSYSIIDNCEVAVAKFRQMNIPGDAYLADVTSKESMERIEKRYDVVYSIGLIEHFRGKDIDQIIKAHFSLCKENGMVLISVPTPTLQYRFVRSLMEKMGVWGFPDEKPIKFDEIKDCFHEADIVDKTINYKLPLTQLMIVAKKNIL